MPVSLAMSPAVLGPCLSNKLPLEYRVADEAHQLRAGSFVGVTPGVVHTFSNTTDAPVRFLNFNTPAGWESYMRDLAAAAESAPLTPEVIGRVASRYDFHPV